MLAPVAQAICKNQVRNQETHCSMTIILVQKYPAEYGEFEFELRFCTFLAPKKIIKRLNFHAKITEFNCNFDQKLIF